MSRNFNTFTISAAAITLLSGLALTGCSSSNDDTSRCCPAPVWHQTAANDDNSGGNTGAAGIMLAEDGEFSIMPVEEPIIIDDQEAGGGDQTIKDIWQQEVEDHLGGDSVGLEAL